MASYVIPSAGLAWSLFWSADRVHTYFVGNESAAIDGFAAAVLPDGAAANVKRGFLDLVVHPLFTEKQTNIRMHVAAGATLALLMAVQLLPVVRAKWMALHRWAGRLVLGIGAVFAMETLYTMFVAGMVPMGPWVFAMDMVSVGALIGGLTMGYVSIKRRDIAAHRRWMTLAVAGCISNPIQRLAWSVLGKASVMGPYTSWASFRDGVTALSCIVALALTLGTWAAYTWPRAPKMKKLE